MTDDRDPGRGLGATSAAESIDTSAAGSPDGPARGSGASIRAVTDAITDPEQRVLARIAEIRKRRPSLRETAITMSHGAGGKASHTLTAALFAPAFSNAYLDVLGDQAQVPVEGLGGAIAVSTDGFVVSPLRFPGGDIGELAVNGTINDLAVGGATPLYLTAAFIIEEGLPVETLRAVVDSMRRAADRAGVSIVSGDTKVVPRGKADQLFITTTGVGLVREPGRLGLHRIRAGDRVLLSGAIGDHGCTVMLARGDVDLEAPALRSDTAPLHGLVAALLEAGVDLHFLRDATRGGVATVLNEIAQQAGVGVAIDEDSLPVHDEVRGVAEILGIDALYIANEGKLVAICAAEDVERALAVMRARDDGAEAALIGEVLAEPDGMVFIRTGFGGTRVVDMLPGDPLPRIC